MRGETFGLAPLEAMTHGCAVLVSDLGCFHDFILPNETGFVFEGGAPIADSLVVAFCDALSDPVRLERVARAGQLKSEEFPRARVAEKFLNRLRRTYYKCRRYKSLIRIGPVLSICGGADNAPCAHFGNFAGSCFVSGPQSRSIRGGFFGCGYLRPRSRGHRSCIGARGSQFRRISLCAIVPVLEIAPTRIHWRNRNRGARYHCQEVISAPCSHHFSQSEYLLLQQKSRSA